MCRLSFDFFCFCPEGRVCVSMRVFLSFFFNPQIKCIWTFFVYCVNTRVRQQFVCRCHGVHQLGYFISCLANVVEANVQVFSKCLCAVGEGVPADSVFAPNQAFLEVYLCAGGWRCANSGFSFGCFRCRLSVVVFFFTFHV